MDPIAGCCVSMEKFLDTWGKSNKMVSNLLAKKMCRNKKQIKAIILIEPAPHSICLDVVSFLSYFCHSQKESKNVYFEAVVEIKQKTNI